MPELTANGIRIQYERTGGDKPPLLLLHGVTDSGQCWPAVAAALEGSFDLIMPDARGHGQSEAPPAGYTAAIMADDVAGLMTALGVGRAAVIGHSMGAITAAVLGAHHPDLVSCLVLVDPPWRYPPQPATAWAAGNSRIRAAALARQAMTDDEMLASAVKANPGMASWDKSELAPWVEAKRRFSLSWFEQGDAEAIDWPDWPSIVPAITCHTLLLTADPAHGGAVTAEAAQRIAELNPLLRIVHIAGAGHNIRREAFAAYIAEVTGFLSGTTW